MKKLYNRNKELEQQIQDNTNTNTNNNTIAEKPEVEDLAKKSGKPIAIVATHVVSLPWELAQ